jgi:phage host-nuclease inhibitor protein Gam
MSYTNPQQFVPQQYAQQNQRLQDTIAGTTAKIGAQYAQQQKELRAENKRTTKENKTIKGKINDRALRLLTSVGDIDNANPSVDFASTYEPLIEQYKSLSESVAFEVIHPEALS